MTNIFNLKGYRGHRILKGCMWSKKGDTKDKETVTLSAYATLSLLICLF